jgi:lysophospholipase L1-like esterase
MRRNLALAIASFVVAMLAAEVGLRAISFSELVKGPSRWPWIQRDSVLGFGNTPGYRHPNPAKNVNINALGFRGNEIAPKPRGVVRVACLGDSTTFGFWQEGPLDFRYDPSYPAELERLARADDLPVEVINGGVLGETSAEGLVQLLTQVLPLEPDVVTLRFGNNDHARGEAVLATSWEYPVVHALPSLAWRSEVVRALFYLYRQGVARFAGPNLGVRVPLDRFEENLRRFVAIAQERHIHLAFLDFPYREIERGPSPGQSFPNGFQNVRSLEELHALHDSYQAIVARVAAETGTPLVLTRDALRAEPEPTFTIYDLSHPNGAGYRVIARRLYAELRRLGWLEPKRTVPAAP